MNKKQLYIVSRLDRDGIAWIKQRVIDTSEKARRILSGWEQQRFLDWEPAPFELLVNTGYSDCVIGVPAVCTGVLGRASGRLVEVDCSITHTVFRVGNSYFPCSEIEPGHTYLCVLDFSSSVPDMVKQLPVFGNAHLPDDLDKSLRLQWDRD